MFLETKSSAGCRTHLVVAEKTSEAVLVDPLLADVDGWIATLGARKLKLRAVVDTHTHADHLSGGTALMRRAGAEYLMHRNSRVAAVSRRVDDGETLGFGEAKIAFLAVPGHTSDSMMIQLPGSLLSGDFLFLGAGGAGRLDLPTGDIHAHYESLRRLESFADETDILPGHDYAGGVRATLASQRSANPVLVPRTREEYFRWWSGLSHAPSDWMAAVVRANISSTEDLAAAPIPADGAACMACSGEAPANIREVSSADLARELRANSPVLLDVREVAEFDDELGHLAGARLIPLGSLGDRLAEIPQGPVVTVCRSGGRSGRAAAQLMKAGWSDVRSLQGGMLAWNAARLPVERASR